MLLILIILLSFPHVYALGTCLKSPRRFQVPSAQTLARTHTDTCRHTHTHTVHTHTHTNYTHTVDMHIVHDNDNSLLRLYIATYIPLFEILYNLQVESDEKYSHTIVLSCYCYIAKF
jgi:hypothetical protein